MIGNPVGYPIGGVETGPVTAVNSEDMWHQPWVDPPGTINARRAAGYAIALIASGLSFTNPTPIPDTSLAWRQQQLSEPVRLKPRLVTGQHQFLAFVEAPPFGEDIKASDWFVPLALPVRKPLGQYHFGDLAASGLFADLLEEVTVGKWLLPLSEPVRLRLLSTAAQLAFTVDPTGLTQPEATAPDKWFATLSLPVRLKPQLLAGSQLFSVISPLAFTSEHIPPTVLKPGAGGAKRRRYLRQVEFEAPREQPNPFEGLPREPIISPAKRPKDYQPGLTPRWDFSSFLAPLEAPNGEQAAKIAEAAAAAAHAQAIEQHKQQMAAREAADEEAIIRMLMELG